MTAGGFRDRVAVVTGASSGIGLAIALALAGEGATLCLVGRRRDALDTVAIAAQEAGGSAFCIEADLERLDDIRRVASACSERERVDVLVHSAGVISLAPLTSAPIGELDRLYRVNVRAPYALTQALLPALLRSRGQVVFVNSTAGLRDARANAGQYIATKHALKAIADSLREEVIGQGVRVLSLYPGRTAGPMQVALHAMEGQPYDPDRLMQPESVAAVVLNALLQPDGIEITDLRVAPSGAHRRR